MIDAREWYYLKKKELGQRVNQFQFYMFNKYDIARLYTTTLIVLNKVLTGIVVTMIKRTCPLKIASTTSR